MLAISFFMVIDPIKRKTPDMGAATDLPTVDVFIPSYNEDAELLAVTLAAAKSMAYPKDKLNIFLLDDGGTEAKRNHKNPHVSVAAIRRHEQLKALCAAMGVHYHARKQKRSCKGRQSQRGFENILRRAGRRLRCRPCPCARFPARNRRGSSRTTRSSSSSRRRIIFSIPTRWKRTSRPLPACRRKTRCSIRSCSAGSTSGMPRSSAARPPCCAARRS